MPLPVASTALRVELCSADETLKEHLELDAILTIVDAKHCLQHITSKEGSGTVNEVRTQLSELELASTELTNCFFQYLSFWQAVQQVAFADKLLLNKVDLVSSMEKEEVLRALRVGCSPREQSAAELFAASLSLKQPLCTEHQRTSASDGMHPVHQWTGRG